MLVRIVKMTFRQDAVNDFKNFFETKKGAIRAFKGCNDLQLWQDSTDLNVFFTYSLWENESALIHYRSSFFFRDTWHHTKQLFAAKAEAWSVNQVAVLQ